MNRNINAKFKSNTNTKQNHTLNAKQKSRIDAKLLHLLSITLFILYGFLTFISFIWTGYVSSTKNDYHELAEQFYDNPIITILIIFSVFTLIFLLERFYGLSKISTKKLRFAATLFIFAAGILWIFMAKTFPVHDQSLVSKAAGEFLHGDYSRLAPKEYLGRFPHQLGIVFILQLIYSIVGEGNTTFIMVLNVIFLCGIYNMLFLSLKKFTPSERLHNIYWLFAFVNFAPIFYCTFVYGTIIGLFCAVTAIYFLIKFSDKAKIKDFVFSLIFFSIACIAKSNYKIFIIAAIIVLIFKAIEKKKSLLVLFAFILIFALASPSLINLYYSSVSGQKIEKGVPSSLWVAMGLQDGPCGKGWYNQYNLATYGKAGNDPAKANELAKENISETFKTFGQNPLYAANFFFEKINSQWNCPSFQSLWMSDYWNNHSGELSAPAKSMYHGILNKIFLKIMDIFALLTWCGCTVFYYINRKNLSITQLIFGIIFLGGFLFHLFWEAKALYTMPYFIISLIPAVYGLDIILHKFDIGINRLINKLAKNK